MKKYEKLKEKEEFFEMANVIQKYTGLPYIIWISVKTGKEGHGPRIKVRVDDRLLSITISDNPDIIKKDSNYKKNIKNFKKLKDFIILNKDLLLKYWESGETMDLIKDVYLKFKKV